MPMELSQLICGNRSVVRLHLHLSATNTAGITVSNLQVGAYIYRLTVTDNDGATDTDDVTVTVNNAPANQAPNANAGPNRIITLPTSSATLNGSGTDADGTIATYLWVAGKRPVCFNIICNKYRRYYGK